MDLAAPIGLNGTGEDDAAAVVERGATHTSRGQFTSRHAHHAWKLHVGVDAPVWVRSRELTVPPSHGARAILVPPNVEHETGAVGWSVALFIEPGSRRTPFRESSGARALDARLTRRALGACDAFMRDDRRAVAALLDELTSQVVLEVAGPCARMDRRVGAALARVRADVDARPAHVAAELGLSVDRLTHLVGEATGMPLRRHALWQRLLRVLSAPLPPASLAAAAVAAGFADHAHMTRTFRRFLGRAPSDFRGPPRVIAPWVDLGRPRPAQESANGS